jgi:broad specificity phosphatase PhoE
LDKKDGFEDEVGIDKAVFLLFLPPNYENLSTKKIYLIRHGQTDFNLKGIVQGSGVDAPLNDKGRAQSLAFFNAYKHIKFNKIYTSVLKRSIESVQSFIDLGIPHEAFAGLNEISWGNREGQMITPDEDAYYHWVLRQWQEGQTSMPIEGGESPQQVADRQRPVMDYIFSQEKEETILICMHGRAIRILLCMLLNYPLKSMDTFEHENLCLYLLNYTGSMINVERYNDTSHLKDLAYPMHFKVIN